MANQFVGEIRMFGGNFAITGWAFCSGQLMSIAQNNVLFALIGTTYGGDGVNTFALPDLQGRRPVHQGQGPGPLPYVIGQQGGAETVWPTAAQLPAHTHPVAAVSHAGNTNSPAGNVWAAWSDNQYDTSGNPGTQLAAATLGPSAGAGGPHDNISPYLAVSFIIALVGVFPSQN